MELTHKGPEHCKGYPLFVFMFLTSSFARSTSNCTLTGFDSPRPLTGHVYCTKDTPYSMIVLVVSGESEALARPSLATLSTGPSTVQWE